MKKTALKIIAAIAALAALLLLCSCGKNDAPATPVPEKPQTSTADIAETENDYAAEGMPFFTPGIWVARDMDIDQSYFYFYDNGESGSLRSLDYGSGVSFAYEMTGDDSAVFHFGAADDVSPCSISVYDEFIGLEFDGYSYALEYLTDDLDYKWYSNIELEQMALKYYAAANDYTPGSTGSVTNKGGMVSIQLYDDLGDHNSTCAWYTVDRLGSGYDELTEEPIDLSPYAED